MLHCEFLLDSSCCYQIWPNKLLAADTNCQVASATKEQKRACLEKKQQWVFMGVLVVFFFTPNVRNGHWVMLHFHTVTKKML